jgi:two-component system, sensor histidine kinase and response regulator
MATVLVIEDDPLIRDHTTEMLRYEGYAVMSAKDGLKGLELIMQESPDLIICDVMMPEMDGYGVLSTLRKTWSTPFIFLTALADRTFMRRGMELGANDYLTKPFTRDELIRAVRAQLGQREALERSIQEEQERVRRSVIRMVTHELRSPLAGMQLAQQLMERQLDHLSKSDLRELLKTLRLGSRRLQNIVDQILLAIQIESGVLDTKALQKEGDCAVPAELIAIAINEARHLAYRNQEMAVWFDSEGDSSMIFGLVKLLVRAYAEIISNAINFSPPESSVFVRFWETEGMTWTSIRDNGNGIPPEKIEDALKSFTQIARESQEQQGLGLGLSLASHIIQLHGGRLQINSTVGVGTEVLIGLPCYALARQQ